MTIYTPNGVYVGSLNIQLYIKMFNISVYNCINFNSASNIYMRY